MKNEKTAARKNSIVLAHDRRLVWKTAVSYLLASARLVLLVDYFFMVVQVYFKFQCVVSILWCCFFFNLPDLLGFFHVGFTLASLFYFIFRVSIFTLVPLLLDNGSC